MTETNYLKYRGKCREMAEAAVKADPTLTLVRGHYHCPEWGEQSHWWAVKQDGTIIDPTAAQFPSNGAGRYVPFSGNVECSNCGATLTEENAWRLEGRYAYCSYTCYGQFVGMIPE